MKISLCVICKDEESLIGGALKSGKEFVDEIIVVDTGSSDRSIEIAKSFGAKVYNEKFNDDFSEIRNKAISYATGDWILFLDCDEYLSEESGKALRSYIENDKSRDVMFIRIVGMLDGQRRSSHNDIRFFKRDKGIFYKGIVGENVLCSVLKNFGRERISYSDLEIYHYGSDKDIVNVDKKVERNINLYKKINENDKNAEYYFKFGNEYGRNNDFRKALEMYNIAIMKSEIDEWIEDMPRLILNKTKCLHKLGMYEEEVMFIRKWERIYKDFKDLNFMKSLIYRDKGKFKESFKAFLSYFDQESKLIYPSSEFNMFIDMDKFKKELFYLSQLID